MWWAATLLWWAATYNGLAIIYMFSYQLQYHYILSCPRLWQKYKWGFSPGTDPTASGLLVSVSFTDQFHFFVLPFEESVISLKLKRWKGSWHEWIKSSKIGQIRGNDMTLKVHFNWNCHLARNSAKIEIEIVEMKFCFRSNIWNIFF